MAHHTARSLLAALSLAGAGAVLLATGRFGAGISPDAVGYVGVARQLLAGQGVSSYAGQPFVIQPPLYPALLALAGWAARTDPLHAAAAVNALLAAVLVLLTARLLDRYQASYPALAPFGPALALISWPFFSIAVMAWSEPLFIALEVAALLCLGRYLQGHRVAWLAGAALLVALACLTRYIGVALVMAAGVLLLWQGARPWGKRLAHLLIFVGLAVLPLWAWLVRNHHLTGTWLGPRQASHHSLVENLALTGAGLAGFWFPEVLVGTGRLRWVLAAAAGLAVLAAAGWLARRPARAALAGLAPVAVWSGAYGAFLVFTSTTTAYDDINLRLLAPLYPGAAVLLLGVAAQCGAAGWPRAARAGLLCCLLLPLAGIAAAGTTYAVEGAGAGTGPDRYNTAAWQRSQIIQHLRQHPPSGPVYSNAPDALYILCGLPATLAPRRENQQGWPDAGQLVWLEAVRRGYLLDPQQPAPGGRLRLAARFADGTLYEFSPAEKE